MTLRKDIIAIAEQTNITIDGKPAILTGYKLPFMKIGSVESGFWEFSDSAIANVLKNKKGEFKCVK